MVYQYHEYGTADGWNSRAPLCLEYIEDSDSVDPYVEHKKHSWEKSDGKLEICIRCECSRRR